MGLKVHPANTAQAKAWDGDEGEFWAAHSVEFDNAVREYHHPFLDAAGIAPRDRVLDIGCGTGQTTRDAARRAQAGSALGVDLSSQMLDVARRIAADEGVANATFEQFDAQVHPFEPGSFDAAISRTGAMFFGEPVAAFANVRRALRPGGTLTLLTWQPLPQNEWIASFSSTLAAGRAFSPPPPTAPGPFSLSDPDRVRSILTDAGFTDVTLDALAAPMYFGKSADDALTLVLGTAGWMLDGLDDEGRARALDALRANLVAHETSDGVAYGSACWLIRAKNG